MSDSLLRPQPIFEQQPKPKSVKIETPIGTVESDSGNHLMDIGTVLIVILAFFLMRKLFKAT